MANMFNGILRLRRDLESNYEIVKDVFIPASGEVCIVDCSGKLRFKVGDGVSNFASLPYLDNQNNSLSHGYLLNDKFYTDSTYTQEIEKSEGHIYVDCNQNGVLYTYDGEKFNRCVPDATDTVAGLVKLYQDGGLNTDGTMSQKAITTGVQSIGFALDPGEEDCLIVDLPWDDVIGVYPNESK